MMSLLSAVGMTQHHLLGNLRGKSKPAKYSDSITPEKIPTEAHTPRKSRRSKDMSPPPLRHCQNRMPEQVDLVKGDCKCCFSF